MAKSTSNREFSTTLTDSIARELRTRIVRGELQPGGRLPSWVELERKYSVTRTTLSRVFRQLKGDGFVYTSSTRGAFVTQQPPHLFRYALVFPTQPGSAGWNRFWRTLAEQAAEVLAETHKEVCCFYDVHNYPDNESHHQLLSEVQGDRFAGIMALGEPDQLSPAIWTREGMPSIGIWDPCPGWSGPSLYIDRQSFVDKALDYLKARGRKRIALITAYTDPMPSFGKAAADRGLTHLPHWQLASNALQPETVRPIVQLLMSLPVGDRPDALVIADDNLIEDAIAALMATGVRVPDELDLVVHTNWPQPVSSVLPVRRLGWDTRQILRTAVELIEAQRHGESVRPHTCVPAVFEDEL